MSALKNIIEAPLTNEAFVEMFSFVKDNRYFYKAFLSIPYATFAETNTKSNILSNIKDTNYETKSTDMELYYRASFFGAGIKEMCRIWLEKGCKESPEEMAQILYKEYTNRNNHT